MLPYDGADQDAGLYYLDIKIPAGEADRRARVVADVLGARIAAGAPLVNRWHKQFVLRLMERRPLSDEERAEAHAAFETQDYAEGRSAFVEKREPEFRGH